MYIKEFDSWNVVKKRLQKEKRKVFIRAGEIRWAAIGVNIGSEIDGKGVSFTRPVLVLHVIGPNLALVIPMSTKLKDIAGYIRFLYKEKNTSLCMHQMRIISQKRILKRKGRISDKKLETIKKEVQKFYNIGLNNLDL